jgi:DNA-binding NarL/FixJ family response regulator
VVDATRAILAGRSFISEPLARTLAHGSPPQDNVLSVCTLSPRELEIFTHIGGCLTVSQIAARLGLSVKTVEAHREHIKNKLALQTSTQVAAAAVRWIDTSSISI